MKTAATERLQAIIRDKRLERQTETEKLERLSRILAKKLKAAAKRTAGKVG